MTLSVDLGTIAAQIGKLIAMLSSTNDAEALAAVRAIGRKLKTSGKDWHWLAAKLAEPQVDWSPAPPPPPSEPTPHPRPSPAPKQQEKRNGWSTLKRSEQLAWLVLLDGQPWLSAKETELVASVRQQVHVGQAFYLAPRHKRALSALMRTAADKGLSI